MSKKEERIGENKTNNQGLKMWIKDYRKSNDIDVQFENGYITKNRTYQEFKNGVIKNIDYVKCKVCKKYILKIKSIEKNNSFFCSKCYNKLQKEKESKKSDYEKLIDYLYELYNGQIPVFVFKQIKDYKAEYGMKDSGILLTLKYIYEQLEMKFDESNGIGMVIYQYENAKKEWLHEQEINKAIEEFEFEDKIETIHRNTRENSYLKKIRDRFNVEDI